MLRHYLISILRKISRNTKFRQGISNRMAMVYNYNGFTLNIIHVHVYLSLITFEFLDTRFTRDNRYKKHAYFSK